MPAPSPNAFALGQQSETDWPSEPVDSPAKSGAYTFSCDRRTAWTGSPNRCYFYEIRRPTVSVVYRLRVVSVRNLGVAPHAAGFALLPAPPKGGIAVPAVSRLCPYDLFIPLSRPLSKQLWVAGFMFFFYTFLRLSVDFMINTEQIKQKNNVKRAIIVRFCYSFH